MLYNILKFKILYNLRRGVKSLKKPSKRSLNYVASIHVSETLHKEK